MEPGTFRPGRYKIKADNDKALSWQTLGLNNRVVCGECFLESGILLLGSKTEESDHVIRKSFYKELKLLPQWNKTLAWGYADTLRHCKESKRNKISSAAAGNPGPARSFESERRSLTLSKAGEVRAVQNSTGRAICVIKSSGNTLVNLHFGQ